MTNQAPITEEVLAKYFGLYGGRILQQLKKLEQRYDAKFDKVFTLLDELAKRADDDDQERAAMTSQLNRHDKWIGQLADKTKIKLQPGR